jgi:hypothetical protein
MIKNEWKWLFDKLLKYNIIIIYNKVYIYESLRTHIRKSCYTITIKKIITIIQSLNENKIKNKFRLYKSMSNG